MTDYNQEYFYLTSTGEYPMLDYIIGNFAEGHRVIPLDINEKRVVVFSGDEIDDPELADFHFIKPYVFVISERLKDVLAGLNLKDVQFLPTLVRDDHGNDHAGFYILHVYNMVECMDMEKSVWEKNPFFENEIRVGQVHKLVFNNELIDKIPLEHRLVFAAKERRSNILFHESVVEKILEIDPTGLTVYRLSTYDPDLPFIEEYIAKRGV